MPSEGLKYVFGGALTAMIARANKISLFNNIRDICRAFSVGFGINEQDGDNIYTNGVLENDINSINGFGLGSNFEHFENNVKSYIDSFVSTSSLPDTQKRALAAAVNCILLGYFGNQNVNLSELYIPIGITLNELSNRIFNSEPFESTDGDDGSPAILIHPFTEIVLKKLLSLNDYSKTFGEIKSSDKNTEIELVHYNWYDTTKIFAGPDFDKIKDCENQYYYLSGRLFYDNLPSDFRFCDEQVINIVTETGNKNITLINNSPCVDAYSYIGPITGTKFYREFNDGPYSSGDFSDAVKAEFVKFDKNKLLKNQYETNFGPIYSYLKDSSGSYIKVLDGTQIDIPGEYNLSGEYQYSPITTGIFPKYQIMRVGDARIRSQCSDIHCTGGIEKLTTGFKFALLEMDEQIWGDRLSSIRVNPSISGSDLVKRAINLSTGVYFSIPSGDGLITMEPDGLGGFKWYVGPPKIDESILPYFAFSEEFQSLTFSNSAAIKIYPALGSSSLEGDTGDSNRIFSLSPILLIDKIDTNKYSVKTEYETRNYPNIKFDVELPSFVSGDDDIKKKVFGMGDFLGGKYSGISTVIQENAGYIYTGYLVNGFTGSQSDLITNFENYKVGSPYNQITYISSYQGIKDVPITKVRGHDGKKNIIEYYYFDSNLIPNELDIQVTGLSELGQLPISLDSDTNYSRTYETQDVENQRQRYFKGPFATYDTRFLYPNAQLEGRVYQLKNGFPSKFKYKIRVREETVKEFYCKFKISQGFSYTTPILTNVVRTPESNFGVNMPQMANFFQNGSYNFDFNQWNISKVGFSYNSPIVGGVDRDYAPYTDSFFDGKTFFIAASGKNAETYINEPQFKQGILITGTDVILHRSYSGNLYRASGAHWYSLKSAAIGMYHGFTGYDISGELIYNKPIFNLKDGIIDRVRTLTALPAFKSGCTSYKFCNVGCTESLASGINNLYTKDINGRIFYSKSGEDPFFFEDMGGRIGFNAENEGGYHPKNIIGDNWVGLSAKSFGYYCSINGDVCDNAPIDSENELELGLEASTNDNRVPSQDSRWFFIESTPANTKIRTRALEYNPMSFNYEIQPFTSKTIIKSNSAKTSFSFNQNYKSFKFDLNSTFPKKTALVHNQWYLPSTGSGLSIGPFDRDVELFLESDSILTGYSSIYINNRRISNLESGIDDGTYSTCGQSKMPSGLVGDFGDVTFHNIRPLTFIPSGDYASINIKGGNGVYVGADPNSYINIRARNTLGNKILDVTSLALTNIKGSSYWLHNHNFINNGMEREFDISNSANDIGSLEGKQLTYISFARTGVLFPIPNSTEFISYKVDDIAGNESYKIIDMEDFYKKKTAKENNTIYYSGWREGSRISFEFLEMNPLMDEIPYESQKVMIPSGNCNIRGEFGYKGQADNCIFTEGVYLKDETPNDAIRDSIYGPDFVSPVLKRVPQFQYPSGTVINPILEAPSLFKQRAGTGYVTPESEFSGLLTSSPDNYNKLLWPALSDLRLLNPEETLETLPPDDGNTFLNSNILISASQGQRLSNGTTNPDNKKIYSVREQWQFYDTISTDALINSGIFLTNKRGTKVQLLQSEINAVLTPIGATISEIKNNLI